MPDPRKIEGIIITGGKDPRKTRRNRLQGPAAKPTRNLSHTRKYRQVLINQQNKLLYYPESIPERVEDNKYPEEILTKN